MKLNFLLCLALCALLLSCDKKEIEEVGVALGDSWKMSSNFLFDEKIQMNSYADDDNLYLLGFRKFSKIRLENDIEYSANYLHNFSSSPSYKFPLTSQLFASTDGENIMFSPTKSPVSGMMATVFMKEIDPAFRGLDFPSYEFGECIGFTSNNVALIPYKVDRAADDSKSIIKFLLVKLQLTGPDNDRPVVSDLKIIDFPSSYYHFIRYLATFDNHFYLGYSEGKFLRISEDGLLEELPFPVLPMFRHQGTYYGFSYDGLYKSANGGNWVRVADVVTNMRLDQLQRIKYYSLGDDLLLGTYNSQLFEVDLKEKELRLKELDNSGLEGNTITSVAQFKDRVYVTTLSGVFYRKKDEFLTYKKQD